MTSMAPERGDTGIADAGSAMLADLQQRTFDYFERYMNHERGLVKDNTRENAPASIAGSGYALACYTVAAYREYLPREVAAERVLNTLRFFRSAPQDGGDDETGHRGFFYHFLDAVSGRRVWKSELSSVDTGILVAGALVARAFFDKPEEQEIRDLAEELYLRVDWDWMLADNGLISHGWKPERGFLRYGWGGYNEGLFLYVLALGSPTHPVPADSYAQWSSTYKWKKLYGHELLFGGPLFMHQLSHIWIDFRGIRDEYMRGRGIDYFENSRRATYVQREYAIRNPRQFAGYGADAWGITAGDGPGASMRVVRGVRRRFFGYVGRGVPFGPDDGTLSPWAVAASLPFAPEIVVPALAHMSAAYPKLTGKYGYKCSFNPTFLARDGGWISQGHYAIDQGPLVLMIENHRSGLLWRLMRECPYVVDGLRRAGFAGGWLDGAPPPAGGETKSEARARRMQAVGR
jgi:hypothetical protein